MISIIAIVGRNLEIGRKGDLVFHLPEDMKFFKETTMGHKVVMGLNTWKSLPAKLSGRENLVVSYEPVAGADETIGDLDGFVRENRDSDEEVFVIGGGMIYRAMLAYADKLYLTEVDKGVPDADTFFPEFNKGDFERKVLKSGSQNGLNYEICCYTRIKEEDNNARSSV